MWFLKPHAARSAAWSSRDVSVSEFSHRGAAHEAVACAARICTQTPVVFSSKSTGKIPGRPRSHSSISPGKITPLNRRAATEGVAAMRRGKYRLTLSITYWSGSLSKINRPCAQAVAACVSAFTTESMFAIIAIADRFAAGHAYLWA